LKKPRDLVCYLPQVAVDVRRLWKGCSLKFEEAIAELKNIGVFERWPGNRFLFGL